MYKILFLLDSLINEESLLAALSGSEFQITVLRRGQRGLDASLDEAFDIAFVSLPRTALMEDSIIRKILRRSPPVPCVIIALPQKEAEALACVEQGAYDYLLTSDSDSRILLTASRALQYDQYTNELRRMRSMVRLSHSPPETIGSSPSMLKVKNSVEVAASSSGNVIIQGEPGTGKQRTAHTIHYLGQSHDGPLVQLNCALVPESLVEVEFFGRETGIFLSDRSVRAGKIEEANGGTLLLVDTDQLHPRLQKRLYKTLLTREVERVGGTTTGRVDIRVIATSTKDLSELADSGVFDRELCNLLGSVRISLPPLRSRRDDIPFLLYRFIDEFVSDDNENPPRPDRDALSALLSYDWPGNISELKELALHLAHQKNSHNFTCQALPERMRKTEGSRTKEQDPDILSGISMLSSPTSIKLPQDGIDLKQILWKLEGVLIEKALKESNGKQTEAAAMLGIKRTTLIEKIKRLRRSG